MKLAKFAVMGLFAFSLTACANGANYCQDHPWVCILGIKGTALEIALISGALSNPSP